MAKLVEFGNDRIEVVSNDQLATKLRAEGWYLTDSPHKIWIKNGEAVVLDVPVAKLVARPGEPFEGVETAVPRKIASIKNVWATGWALPIPEGVLLDNGVVQITDGRHRVVSKMSMGHDRVLVIVANDSNLEQLR